MKRLLQTIIPILAISLLFSCSDNSTGTDGSDNGNNGDDGGDDPVTYTVSVSKSPSEAGTIDPSTEETYEEGETAELQASSDEGYRFTEWTGDMESADNPLSFTVDQDYELTANFEKKNYELTVNTEGEGQVAEEVIEEKSTDYEHGTVVKLTANPAEGYAFVEWKGDLSGTENPQQITVDDAKEVTAVFEAQTGSVEVSTSTSGDNLDSDGYAFTIADRDTSIGVNETITMSGLDEGTYQVELADIAENCSLDGDNPKSIEVTAGETISITFNVSCEAQTGTVEFTIETMGKTQDLHGYFIEFANKQETTSRNDQLTFNDIEIGNYDVELSAIRGNCNVNGNNPRTIEVQNGKTTNNTFEVTCNSISRNSIVLTTISSSGEYSISTIDPDGNNKKELETSDNGTRLRYSNWSTFGARIAYAKGNVDDGYDVYTVNPDDKFSDIQVTNNSVNGHNPKWSPDGTRLVFSTGNDIFTIKPDGTDRKLILSEYGANFPSWSPDGSRIVFSSKAGNGDDLDIYSMNSDGTDIKQITETSRDDKLPSWSPDGSRIAFVSSRSGNWEIYTMNPDGTDLKQVTERAQEDTHPDWSPDGSRLIFASDRDGDFDIYTINPDGTDIKQITDNYQQDLYPDWIKVE